MPILAFYVRMGKTLMWAVWRKFHWTLHALLPSRVHMGSKQVQVSKGLTWTVDDLTLCRVPMKHQTVETPFQGCNFVMRSVRILWNQYKGVPSDKSV